MPQGRSARATALGRARAAGRSRRRHRGRQQGARLEYAHATLRDDADVLLRAMEAALVLEDARGGASVANLFRDQLESASARLRADVSFARGCLSLPSLARLTIEEHGLRDHMSSLWVHLHPNVWLDTDVLLAAAALYSPEVFPLLWPTERLQAAVSDPFVGRPAWSSSHHTNFFEHYCVHGDDASMLRGGEHLRAARRWDSLQVELRSYFETSGAIAQGSERLHLGGVEYWFPHRHAYSNTDTDVMRALRCTGTDVQATIALLESGISPEALHAREVAHRAQRRVLCTGGVEVAFHILRVADAPTATTHEDEDGDDSDGSSSTLPPPPPKEQSGLWTHNGPLLSQPTWGEELHNDALREALIECEATAPFSPRTNPNPRMRTASQRTVHGANIVEWIIGAAIPPEVWGAFGIHDLHAGHWIRVGAHYWAPTELGLTDLVWTHEMCIHAPYAEALAARRAERQCVLALVGVNGMALQAAATELRADREVVMAAVTQNGEALRFASEDLKADRDVVLAAVRQGGYSRTLDSDVRLDARPRRAARRASPTPRCATKADRAGGGAERRRRAHTRE